MVTKQILDNISLKELRYKYVIVQKGYFKDRLYNLDGLIKEFDPSFKVERLDRHVSKNYKMRCDLEGLPFENEHLVYGKLQKVSNRNIVPLGEILHLSELLNENNELVVATKEDIAKRRRKLKYNPLLINEGYTSQLCSLIKVYKKIFKVKLTISKSFNKK